MGVIDSPFINLMDKTLDGLWTRQDAISDNMANFQTPNYKKKMVSFENQLEEILSESGSKSSEINKQLKEQKADISQVDNEKFRLDGNGVDLETESLDLVRTSYQYMYVQRLLSDQFSRLSTAINEGH